MSTNQQIIPYPFVDRKVRVRTELIAWLKRKSEYSNNVFEDPGYSNFYKRYYGIIDRDGSIYRPGDIDHELNIHYVKSVDEDEKTDEDRILDQYIDFIPKQLPRKTVETICDIYPQHEAETILFDNMVVLPGSNHSNANYLFKRVSSQAKTFKPYHVPVVDADPSHEYRGDFKEIPLVINKEEFYQFIKNNSLSKYMK